MSKFRNTCSVVGCDFPTNVSYFKYPIRDRDLVAQWLRLTGKLATQITELSKVCQTHFEPSDLFKNQDRNMLLKTAYPKLNLPEPIGDDVDISLDVLFPLKDTDDLTDEMGAVALEPGQRRAIPARKAKDVKAKVYKETGAEAIPGVKKSQKKKKSKAKRLYDENGILIHVNKDLCDCMIEECPGCYFPCKNCNSEKCGHVCRNNREWQYDFEEEDGFPDTIVRNPYLVYKSPI